MNIRRSVLLCLLSAATGILCAKQTFVELPARDIPVIDSVDLVVVGGNEGGLAAAWNVAKSGAKVILLSDFTFLGDEYLGRAKQDLPDSPTPETPFTKELFADPDPSAFSLAASRLLREAGVVFLDNSRYAGLLRGADGSLCGVATANKAGVQAILAKVVLDATPASRLADDAGLARTQWTAQTLQVSRRQLLPKDKTEWITKEAPMPEFTWAALNRAEQSLREPRNVVVNGRFAHRMDFLMPTALALNAPFPKTLKSVNELKPEMFRSAAVPNLFVIGSSVAKDPAAAKALMRPIFLSDAGAVLAPVFLEVLRGRAAPAPDQVSVQTVVGETLPRLAVRELTGRERPYLTTPLKTVKQPAIAVPVWAEYDVIVVGGGPAGHAAAIAAGRKGCRTLLVEQSGFLGGNVALGITGFWRGYRRGFNQEWQKKRKSAYPEMLNEAGVDIWYGSLAVGTVMDGNVVKGIEVATWLGRGAALAKIVVDATGDGDLCAIAGAKEFYVNDGSLCIEEASFRGHYANSLPFDPMDIPGATLHRVLASEHIGKNKVVPLPQIRETRRIEGDYVIDELDVNSGRTYPDVIGVIACAFDPHGYYLSDWSFGGLMLSTKHVKEDVIMYVPLRSCIPKGLEGMYMAGRFFSCTHDVQALARMNPDMLNQGYAIGVAAALCVKNGTPVRKVDIQELQRHLAEVDCLPVERLREIVRETPPPSAKELAAAAENPALRENLLTLARGGKNSLAPLRASFERAPTPEKAKALCLLGDAAGVSVLAKELASLPFPEPAPYAWDGFLKVPPFDGAVWCLAIPGDRKATAPLIDVLKRCDGTTAFNTLRAVTQALGRLGDPAAAPALADFLRKPGVQGHDNPDKSGTQSKQFSQAMVELFAADALVRCGDSEGLGRSILTRYLADWRGIFVRYAGHALETAGK